MITAVLSATSALAPYGQPMRAGRPAPLRFCSAPAMVSKEQADAESNARLMAALGVFGDGEEEEAAVVDADEPMDSLYQEDTLIRSKEVPSHMQLDLDDEGNPTLIRFAYVDEPSCIGCTYCADVARNTFYMDDEAGRARVFNQNGDSPEVVMEAIDSCPVNCISYVDHEDLVILETERSGQSINPMTIGIPATWSARMNGLPPTKAKLGGSRSLVCCNNCPSKGCKNCPMFGVGQNPVYIARMEAREAKKEESGEAAVERRDAAIADSISALYSASILDVDEETIGVVVPSSETDDDAPAWLLGADDAGSADGLPNAATAEGESGFFQILFEADPYGIDDNAAGAAAGARGAATEEDAAAAERRADAERELVGVVAAVDQSTSAEDVARLTEAVDKAIAAGVASRGDAITEARETLATLQAAVDRETARRAAEEALAMALKRALARKGDMSTLMSLESALESAAATELMEPAKLDAARVVLESKGRTLPDPADRWWT